MGPLSENSRHFSKLLLEKRSQKAGQLPEETGDKKVNFFPDCIIVNVDQLSFKSRREAIAKMSTITLFNWTKFLIFTVASRRGLLVD